MFGASFFASFRESVENERTIVLFVIPVFFITLMISFTCFLSFSSTRAVILCFFSNIRVSFTVGIFSPLPAFSFLSSFNVFSCTAPLPFVVLSSVWSCITIGTLSFVMCVSNSIALTLSCIALRKLFRVFSGSRAFAPRCPTSSILSLKRLIY